MQLAKLSAEVANQASQQELEPRRKYAKQSSVQAGPHNYASPMDRQGAPGKIRITSKDRSMSGNKRAKQSQSGLNKIASPQRTEMLKQIHSNAGGGVSAQGYAQPTQSSASKFERQR